MARFYSIGRQAIHNVFQGFEIQSSWQALEVGPAGNRLCQQLFIMENKEVTGAVTEEVSRSIYPCSSLTQLSGGTANFVYRGVLLKALHDGTTTIIVKHAEDYVASNRDFKLTAERCRVEESALTAVNRLASISTNNGEHEGQRYQITVRTPRIFHFNSQTNTQIMEDLPDALDLKTFLISQSGSQTIPREWALSVGRTLGIWLRSFHSWSSLPEQAEVAAEFDKNKFMKDLKFSINYNNLINMIGTYPELLEESRPILEKVREMAAEELGKTGGGPALFGPIHGDFWSGNVLIPQTALDQPSPTTHLFIIDWELAQCGNRGLDLGQMIAELYMLKHFKDIDAGLWAIEGLAGGYQDISDDLAFRTLIHVGVHLICWGSTIAGWGTKDQIRAVICTGRDLITKAWERDRTWFEERVWKCMFSI
ncbi:hypothetical protein ARAM_000374 [Aspergillus rambellii]|uniref:Uncharacterized protein n=1 Tax=Aspergillus rambellii TaxID=308745 RepID=A0A0F8XB66_9EURO|nr:hypothetical protein ARAM_000374 [Aspergillus rambellii]